MFDKDPNGVTWKNVATIEFSAILILAAIVFYRELSFRMEWAEAESTLELKHDGEVEALLAHFQSKDD